jgi:hypothetical protein
METKHLYCLFELIDGNLANPLYFGISKNPHSDPRGIFIGTGMYKKGTPEFTQEFFENFKSPSTPYIRRCDFGENSMEGLKAKITFDTPSQRCKDMNDYFKTKKLDIDFTTRVIEESSDWDKVNVLEYLFVKYFGIRKDVFGNECGGLLFNKIPGGHLRTETGCLIKQFNYDENKLKRIEERFEKIYIEKFYSNKKLDTFIH